MRGKYEGDDGVERYPDSREVCVNNARGQREYIRRLVHVWTEQMNLCALCKKYIDILEAQADHIKPRGMGGATRDDRIENLQAVCGRCNSLKGSQRMENISKDYFMVP